MAPGQAAAKPRTAAAPVWARSTRMGSAMSSTLAARAFVPVTPNS